MDPEGAFSRGSYNDELQAFQLAGNRYQAMELLSGKLWIPDLGLGLALWQGEYRGKERQWLRWYAAQSNWIPTEAEMVQQAEQRAEKEFHTVRQSSPPGYTEADNNFKP